MHNSLGFADLVLASSLKHNRRLKLREIDPTVKAIVSSGYSDSPVIANYAHYGFCEVVAKPYEMIEFSQKLHRVVNDT